MLSLRSFELRTVSPLTRTPSMNATWCVKASDLRRSLDVPARRTCEVRTLSPLSRAPSMNAIRCVKASTFAMSRRSKQMHSRQLGWISRYPDNCAGHPCRMLRRHCRGAKRRNRASNPSASETTTVHCATGEWPQIIMWRILSH